MRRRVRRPAPVVRDRPMREALMRLAWMDGAALTHERQQVLRPLLPGRRPGRRDPPRVHQRRDVSGDEAVVDEDVFLDAERRIQPLEIAGAVVDGAMTQRQVLRARRRADGIRLHESQPAQRAFQRGSGETGCGRLRTVAGRRGRWARLNLLQRRRCGFRLQAEGCVRSMESRRAAFRLKPEVTGAKASRDRLVGDGQRRVDDGEPLAQLRLGDRQRRVGEEVVPAHERVETLRRGRTCRAPPSPATCR